MVQGWYHRSRQWCTGMMEISPHWYVNSASWCLNGHSGRGLQRCGWSFFVLSVQILANSLSRCVGYFHASHGDWSQWIIKYFWPNDQNCTTYDCSSFKLMYYLIQLRNSTSIWVLILQVAWSSFSISDSKIGPLHIVTPERLVVELSSIAIGLSLLPQCVE